MNADQTHKLARRFIELSSNKRRLFLEGLKSEGVDFSLLPIPAQVAVEDRDALSYAQQRMWFLWQLDPQSAAYNLPMAVRLKGELNGAALQHAFDVLVARHESLRSRFVQEGDTVRQLIADHASLAIRVDELKSLTASERDEQVAALAETEAAAPFDLAQGSLLRVRLLKLAEDEHVLLLTLHHIIADGWSLNLLIDEFMQAYDAACEGREAALAPLPIQYRDYALWQRSWLEAGEREQQLAYWQDKLGDDHSPLDLPLDRQRTGHPSHQGARYSFEVEASLAEQLRTLARQHNVTLFVVLLAAFKLLLQRHSGQTAIRVGVPIANRNHADVEGLIGCFINTQVLHTEIDPLLDISQLLLRVKDTALGAQAHQDLPFEQLVEALGLDRSTGQAPLFQVLFNHQATVADVQALQTRSGLTMERVEPSRHTARFDLSLDTYERGGRLYAALTYATDVFDTITVERLQAHWLLLLEQMAGADEGVVGEFWLSRETAEVAEVPIQRGDTCIHQLIEQAASQHPDELAAVSGDDAITYGRLEERARQVAQVLLAAGVQPDQRVGLVADRSVDMLVGMLGILKAGAAYLPLEPEQPQERLAFMLADSAVDIVLGRSSWAAELPADVRLLNLDGPMVCADETGQLPVSLSADNLAYVIYTSGTTGMPKGVAVSHGALVNYVQGVSQRLPMEAVSNLAMVSTPAADLGHTILFGALCAGKTLHLLDKSVVLDADAFGVHILAHQVDVLKIVPSHLEAMLVAGASALPEHCLILGGEACPPALLAKISRLAPELLVINHYGPTETTVGVLTAPLRGIPVLGSPLENVSARVLDACLSPVPTAAKGELYISGAALARGYLGRPGLTAERFVPNPVGDGARMYRTGDWVRRNAAQELLFAGRMDGQVKIRGYRVELAEIESRLRSLPGVANALVRVFGDAQAKQLAAYLVPAETGQDQQAFTDGVRVTLKRILPEHMVPAYLIALERFPVTVNGKVDVKALPEPVAASAIYEAPITELQIQLAAIWGEVLRVERVGLTDNFFELGGHSLLATQVVSRARQHVGLDIPLRTLFDTADLQTFALAVSGTGREVSVAIELLDRSSPLPVSHAQHRQWLFWKLHPQSTAYNTPLAVRLRGNLDSQALQGALDALVARHESLRTIFREENGMPWQQILPASSVVIDVQDLRGKDEISWTSALESEATAAFDLANGPLLRIKLFQVDDDEHLLAVTLHHIVSDGWSMSVMVREFARAYNALAAGDSLAVQPLPVQYADYAAWQRQRLADGQLQAQLGYWKAKLEDDFDVLELPADRPRPQVQSYQGERIDVCLPADLTNGLRRLAVDANATLFHVFLAAFAILLSRYSGKDKINIGVPVTNRNRLELEGLIGFFVNTIVARIGVDHTLTFTQLLEAVKETTLEAQANKDVPFDALVEELKPERGLGHNPLFQVMYNHLRDFGEQVSADSLHGLHVEEIDLTERSAQFDITLTTSERQGGVFASFGYSKDLFLHGRIENMAEQFLVLLQELKERGGIALGNIDLYREGALEELRKLWGEDADFLSEGENICALFETQVSNTPQALAVVTWTEQVSYAELNARANHLARILSGQGINEGAKVGILAKRSVEMVVAMLGVLKVGAAYVPLDPDYPIERLTYMINDSAVEAVVYQSGQSLPAGDWVALECSGFGQTDSNNFEGASGSVKVPAYLIYTSGSTGQPKGAIVRLDSLSRLICWYRNICGLGRTSKVLLASSFSFDLTQKNILATICAGGQLHMACDGYDPQVIARYIDTNQITLINCAPSAFYPIAQYSGATLSSLRHLVLGGEPIRVDEIEFWYRARHASPLWLHNTYGPTECTDVVSAHSEIMSVMDRLQDVPIGRPLPGVKACLLNSILLPVGFGQLAELYLGGSCVGDGYWNRPRLTAERFVPDPYSNGSRLYRTGDLARYRADGVLDYVGRIDHQVKIRGFRIELGEIESRLCEHPALREAVVLASEESGYRQLVGYLVAEETLSEDQRMLLLQILREYLLKYLPSYMVPAYLVFLDSMPLTPNGKLDRKALPKLGACQLQQEYVAPQSKLEQQIAVIWADVLKLERVGLTDNFFELGGHSLLATQVVSRVHQSLDLDVPLKALFERSDLVGFAQAVRESVYSKAPSFIQADRSKPLSLSYAQQRQWFLWQLEPESTAYNMPTALRFKGPLDIDALRSSFESLIARHETLRTTFCQEDEQAVQVIHPAVPFELVVEGLQVSADIDLNHVLKTEVEAEVQRAFDLEQGPLLRVKLLRLSEEDHVLVLTLHHIVSDGWSMPIMIDELVQLYEGYRVGEVVSLPELSIQYADYAIWQRQWMEAGERERQLVYWKEQLGDEQPVLELPLDRPRPSVQSYAGANLEITLDEPLAHSLKQLAKEQGSTLFMLLLASFQTLLHRYSGQSDIRVGVPIANRNRVETERLIGFFVNTQVLKAEFDLNTTFSALLKQVQQAALDAQAHQDLPFEQLVEALQPERSLSHSPLFQVMYNHQSQVRGNSQALSGLTVESLFTEQSTAKFDLTLDTYEYANGIGASLCYATDLFDKASIERLSGHWINLLNGIVKAPQQWVSELPLLSEQEHQQIVCDWNRTRASYPNDQCIHQLIEAQADKTPNAIAVVFDNQELTYQQLNGKANQLAHKLREQGVGPDVLVGIAVERSLEMVVGLLGVLKAGGAYVPLDPEYPEDRLAYMMEDSGIALLLTQAHLQAQLPIPDHVHCLMLDEGLKGYSDTNPINLTQPDNLAYVIYTSGSTGRPKGVAISHDALSQHAHVSLGFFNLSANDRILQFATFNFDGFVEQLYPALICGASVVIRGRDIWDSETFYQELLAKDISVVDVTTAYWFMLAKDFAEKGPRDYGRLHQFHSGGEAMPPEGVAAWKKAGLEHVHLLNTYGPTEATVTVSAHDCADYLSGKEPLPVLMPIGKVLPGRTIYLLDHFGKIVVNGAIGELTIGGELLARGYFNRPALTAERFIPDPFDSSEQGGGRLYRTGDLTRYLDDGVIEYVGRIDHQVKIRGFRIELGEIEARLQEHRAIRETLVVDIDGPNGKQLVAYLVADAEQLSQADLRAEVREHLKGSLPDYMVPAHLVFLETMPLTPNGKLDRKALPKPDASQVQQEYVAPQSELEQQIAAIWADVLKVERVGLSDNFFELGGHSLLATQVISRIRQVLGREVALKALFEAPELGDFTKRGALSGEKNQVPMFTQVRRDQPLALSYAQQRLWFLWQLEPESSAYNMPTALRLKGSLDIEALRSSFEALIARHEPLRTTFSQDGDLAIQVIHPGAPFEISVEMTEEHMLEALVDTEAQRPFDLEKGPLLRVKLLQLAEDDHVLMLTLHHIVSDAWSTRVMVDELIQLYEACRSGQMAKLPEMAIQYADYAVWQRNWMEAGEQDRQLTYWKSQLGDVQPVLELPTDRPRPMVQNHAGASLAIELDEALASALKRVVQQQGVTLFMVLLASFQTLLHRYSGQDDIRVGVPIANRNRVETERLIGFFVNTQVLKAEFNLDTTFSALLKQVQQTALEAQAHQDLPFEQLVEALHPERSLSHSPLFQVMYNHQSQALGESLTLPGLTVDALFTEQSNAKFDLTLDTYEHANGIGASLCYATALFDEASIERLTRHWVNLLEGIVKTPEHLISSLPMLDNAESQYILSQWDQRAAVYPSDRYVHQLFEDRAQQTPDALAILFDDQHLTYAQLDSQANRLAHRLIELGVGPEVRVAIAMRRSAEIMVAFMAVLKAGGAYVPLDVAYPQDRLLYMMEDCAAALVLTQSDFLDVLAIPTGLTTVLLDQRETWSAYSDSAPNVSIAEDNLAYVIYTSGSTGKPKGVAVSHGPLVAHVQALGELYETSPDDCELHFMSFAFDGSHEGWMHPLINGARVLVRDDSLWLPEHTYAQMRKHGVTMSVFPPIYLQQLAEHALLEGNPPSTRVYCFGGDAMPQASYELAWKALRPKYLFNGYGPTETVVTPLLWKASEGEPCGAAYAPIGKLVGRRRSYILGNDLNLLPVGFAGELYLGGYGIARGYLDRPDLTAERFIPDLFGDGERVYRSGDLTRARADGVVDYLGRIDYQVKIRGFRIELGEIEARLQELDAVREAVVVDIEGSSGKQLVAYLITEDDMADQQVSLRTVVREHLKANLPDYMVPAHLLFLKKMPLTPNGKLDRKALPKPDASQLQQEYVAPQSELEQQISEIWADVLKIDKVGLTDNFFELGGHSLLAISVISRLQLLLGFKIEPLVLFKTPVLKEFSEVLHASSSSLFSEKLERLDIFAEELEGI